MKRKIELEYYDNIVKLKFGELKFEFTGLDWLTYKVANEIYGSVEDNQADMLARLVIDFMADCQQQGE